MYAGCVVSVILEWQADTTRTSSATDNCPVLPDRQPPSFPPRQTTAQFFTTDNRPVLLHDRQLPSSPRQTTAQFSPTDNRPVFVPSYLFVHAQCRHSSRTAPFSHSLMATDLSVQFLKSTSYKSLHEECPLTALGQSSQV